MMERKIVFLCLLILVSGETTTGEPDNGTTSTNKPSTPGSTATTGKPSTAAPCADAISDCQQYLAQCTDPNYQPLMYIKCRLTCKLCNACFDDDQRCTKWVKNGFCTNPFYQNLWDECKKSCGRCPS